MFPKCPVFQCSNSEMPPGTSTAVHVKGEQAQINQSSCKHEPIYSAFMHFPKNYMAVMDLQFIIAGGMKLG